MGLFSFNLRSVPDETNQSRRERSRSTLQQNPRIVIKHWQHDIRRVSLNLRLETRHLSRSDRDNFWELANSGEQVIVAEKHYYPFLTRCVSRCRGVQRSGAIVDPAPQRLNSRLEPLRFGGVHLMLLVPIRVRASIMARASLVAKNPTESMDTGIRLASSTSRSFP